MIGQRIASQHRQDTDEKQNAVSEQHLDLRGEGRKQVKGNEVPAKFSAAPIPRFGIISD